MMVMLSILSGTRISHILLCYRAEFLISFHFVSIDLISKANRG